MQLLRYIDDAINRVYRWADDNRFAFFAGIYLLIFAGPIAWSIFNDIAEANHSRIFLMAWALLIH